MTVRNGEGQVYIVLNSDEVFPTTTYRKKKPLFPICYPTTLYKIISVLLTCNLMVKDILKITFLLSISKIQIKCCLLQSALSQSATTITCITTLFIQYYWWCQVLADTATRQRAELQSKNTVFIQTKSDRRAKVQRVEQNVGQTVQVQYRSYQEFTGW